MVDVSDDSEEAPARFWNENVGPFYDAEGLRASFGYTRSFLDERIRTRDVLHVISGDGEVLFPAFQFDADGGLAPRMAEMLELIDPTSHALWGDAMWLNAPDEDLGGLTPVEALRTGQADDALRIGGDVGAFWLQ